MEPESIELGFLSIFALLTFFIFLIVNKNSHKISNGALLDNDFTKPQAFHKEPVPRSGGVASLISLFLFLIIYNVLYTEILYNYLFICSSLFFVGYLDDLKIKINPNTRLVLMIVFFDNIY